MVFRSRYADIAVTFVRLVLTLSGDGRLILSPIQRCRRCAAGIGSERSGHLKGCVDAPRSGATSKCSDLIFKLALWRTS